MYIDIYYILHYLKYLRNVFCCIFVLCHECFYCRVLARLSLHDTAFIEILYYRCRLFFLLLHVCVSILSVLEITLLREPKHCLCNKTTLSVMNVVFIIVYILLLVSNMVDHLTTLYFCL